MAAASSKPKEEGLGFCSVGPSDLVMGLGPACNEIQGPLSAQQQSCYCKFNNYYLLLQTTRAASNFAGVMEHNFAFLHCWES